MNIVLSINNKFFEKSPRELIKLVKKYDSKRIIKGFEIYIDFEKENEKEYMKKLCLLCKKENYIFQIHGMYCSYERQFEYIDFVNELSGIMGKTINIVIHPVTEVNIEKSIFDTKVYFSEIINYIKERKYNICISIENLNYMGVQRINKENIEKILKYVNNLNFTYDLGHVIIDNKELEIRDKNVIDKINNVHIHTFKDKIDHQPIGFSQDSSQKWKEGMKYLKRIKYDKVIVLEYDFYALGDMYEERLKKYIESAGIVSEYYKQF